MEGDRSGLWRRIGIAATHAAYMGDLPAVMSFVKAGIKCDEPLSNDHWTTTLLHSAVSRNGIEVLKYLVQQKPNLDVRDEHGQTVLHQTNNVIPQNETAAKVLSTAGANLDIPDPRSESLHRVQPVRAAVAAPAELPTTQTGVWSANGLCSEFRVLYPHPTAAGWFRVLTAAGENWAPENELEWCAV